MSLFKRLFVLGALLFAVPVFAQSAPPADAPKPKVGDSFDVADTFLGVKCKHWVLKDLDRGGYLIWQCEDKLVYLSADHGFALVKILTDKGQVLASYTPYLPPLAWPLAIGKKWSGRYSGYTVAVGTSWEADSTCEVKAIEPLRIGGRDVWTYRYDCADSWWSGILSGTAYSTGWYAPQAKIVVKAVLSGNPNADWQIVGFSTR
jgi:hypothetical protein